MRNTIAIIAGTNKAGTTSLFRYLSDHPGVCGSDKKELQFFSQPQVQPENYIRHFQGAVGDQLLLEATPDYMARGTPIAHTIHQHFPDSKILFVLREPVARLQSFFKSYQSRDSEMTAGFDFDSWVKDVIAGNNPEALRELDRGRYKLFLSQWLSYFGPQQIHLVFFDELSSDPSKVVENICEFLDLDDEFYQDYHFGVENKTRSYRSSGLHKLVHSLNMRFEPFLNRNRRIKEFLRKIYTGLNESQSKKAVTAQDDLQAARDYYTKENAGLRDLLEKNFGLESFPDWIK